MSGSVSSTVVPYPPSISCLFRRPLVRFGYSRTLGPSWVHAYRDLIARAAERLFEESGFFGRLAHAPSTIYGRASATVAPKALNPLLHFADHLFYRLMERELDGKETGTAAREAEVPTTPVARRQEILDEAWRDMAAGWESLLQEIAVRSARGERDDWSWEDFRRIAENVADHLRFTTEMVGQAVWQVRDYLHRREAACAKIVCCCVRCRRLAFTLVRQTSRRNEDSGYENRFHLMN